MKVLAMIGCCICLSTPVMAAERDGNALPEWGIGPFVRDDGADHIGPLAESTFRCSVLNEMVKWECDSVLCAGAVVKDGKVYVLYRARDKPRGNNPGTSRIGLAVSEDGRKFKRHQVPVLYPAKDACEKYEWPGGGRRSSRDDC